MENIGNELPLCGQHPVQQRLEDQDFTGQEIMWYLWPQESKVSCIINTELLTWF